MEGRDLFILHTQYHVYLWSGDKRSQGINIHGIDLIHLEYRCFSTRTEAYIDGLVQERRNSIANALELRLSCTNPW